MSDEMVTWLQAQVDEDEEAARAAGRGKWVAVGLAFVDDSSGRQVMCDEYIAPGVRDHIVRHDPARVLREVEAKRRIMDRHRDDGYGACLGCGFGNNEERMVENVDECPVLRLLALPYSDRAGYREEWRP